ncbi:fibroblast growth factor-binding protein 1 [Amia ocellicauda]|uniref:fibroblast growth factor-binding protein 1 n=1 Tax=Amia ocellicauda TaxID=2972642 RepID=UPI003464E260
MIVLQKLTVALVLVCVAQMVLVANGEKDKEGKKKKKEGDKTLPDTKQRHHKSQADKSLKGKFASKDKKTQCSWAASAGDTTSLRVSCQKEEATLSCEYTAKPAACPESVANPKAFWKQIAKALRKEKQLCKDGTGLIKAGMCKKAPKEAHFRLSAPAAAAAAAAAAAQHPAQKSPGPGRADSATPQPAITARKDCLENIEKKKAAEEYCSGSWSSLCSFFISMVDNEDC